VTTIAFVISVVFGLMLAEARVSSRHEHALRARGAEVPSEPQYRWMALLYPVSFLAMGLEALLRRVEPSPIFLSGLLLFIAAKALKYWAIASLGERWTFKVVVLPRAPLVRTGPYRYVAHPNYIAVAGELAGVAMMTGARVAGPIMGLTFIVMMWRRARFEERALHQVSNEAPL
jgi:methyltransferase